MSSKAYQDAYRYALTSEQRDIMFDLFMKGVNHDGHSWVTFSDVEEAVAALFGFKEEEE